MRRAAALPAAALLVLAVPASAQTERAPELRTVVEGADSISAIAFTSDGRMVFGESSGRVWIVQDGVLRERPIAALPTDTELGPGLLAIEAPADVSSDPAVYALATEPGGNGNRIWRIPLDLSEPSAVVSELPAGGGGLAFDSAGNLLVSAGDEVRRYTPEGGVPAGNPSSDPTIVEQGLREPGGLAVDPLSGAAVVVDAAAPTELRLIDPELVGGPLLTFEASVAPDGLTFAPTEGAGPGFAGDLFVGADDVVRRVELDEERTRAEREEAFVDAGAPVPALAWGPGGLYLSTGETIELVPEAAGAAGSEPDPVITMPPGGREVRRANPLVFVIFTAVVVLGIFATRRRAMR